MPSKNFVTLTDQHGATALIAPELGGWLLRYTRLMPEHGPVEALHFSQAVLDRYPREMYAGNPLLFPLVSFNHMPHNDHHYEWNGHLYELPQHGFARRCKWSVVAQEPGAVTLEMGDNETTRASYPFSFRQRLTYRLEQGRLHWVQEVENLSPEVLPFSTGFHPYLKVPLTARSERAACFVEIPEGRRLTMHGRGEHFSSKPFPAQNWSVQEDMSATMFLADLKKRELILVDPASELEVVLNFEDAPQHRFVAIWAKSPSEPYYCLEPWTALSNSFTRVKEHELILLPPGKTFRAVFWLELRRMA